MNEFARWRNRWQILWKNNWTIIDGNATNISLFIIEGKYGAIDNDDSLCHGYYIIKFSSYQYTLQSDLSIDWQVISSG